jgi:hypothetical protein
MIKCRVCGREVKEGGWSAHVNKHKRDYCRVIGRNESEAWRVNWEDVVAYYNPSQAHEDRLVGYAVPKHKKLTEYF